MATICTCLLLLALLELLRVALYIITIPFRIIRVLFGGRWTDPSERETRPIDDLEDECFDRWYDDQGL